MTDPTEPTRGSDRSRRQMHRIGLVIAVALIALSVLLLPFVFRSVGTELLSRQDRILYNGITGEPLPLTPPEVTEKSDSFFTIGVLDIDKGVSQATLAISGNRACRTDCSTIDLIFYALDDNVTQRRGVPPVQTVTLKPDDVMFSQTVTLPVRGTPNMYPFNTYVLWLGMSATLTPAGGTPQEITLADFHSGTQVALQNLDSTLLMAQPRPVDPAKVHAPTDPYQFIAVQSLEFREPTYLIVLSVLLVLLISLSSGIAMTTRNYQDLVLGVGGIVLGVWGVRSILSVSSAPSVTLLDLSLSVVILLLLLTFIVRSALFFHRNAELPPIREIRPVKAIRRKHE